VFTAYLFRIGLEASIICALVLAVLTPIVVPVIFGPPYGGAIGPALLLIPGGVAWSGQWILCRAAAARGATRPLIVSFAASFIMMIALDLVLIAPFGVTGAAIASSISSAVGFAIASFYYIRDDWHWRLFMPRLDDLAHIARETRGIGARLIGRRGRIGSDE
jgi:O-antigen/teichoic acid export membrane protein